MIILAYGTKKTFSLATRPCISPIDMSSVLVSAMSIWLSWDCASESHFLYGPVLAMAKRGTCFLNWSNFICSDVMSIHSEDPCGCQYAVALIHSTSIFSVWLWVLLTNCVPILPPITTTEEVDTQRKPGNFSMNSDFTVIPFPNPIINIRC